MVAVGSPLGCAVQCGDSASASSLRQMPPPAVATQARQAPLPVCPASQVGLTTSAVTRPEVNESRRLSVVGPGVNGTSGPANCQFEPTSWRAETSGVPGANERAFTRVG